jgi:hypothetical protein
LHSLKLSTLDPQLHDKPEGAMVVVAMQELTGDMDVKPPVARCASAH